MIREETREREHIPLPVAVAVVINRLTGTHHAQALELFDDVARTMAHIVPIYTRQPNGMAKELSHMEVVQGRFEQGAIFFRSVDGVEYHNLTVQRRDVARSIEALKAANLRLK